MVKFFAFKVIFILLALVNGITIITCFFYNFGGRGVEVGSIVPSLFLHSTLFSIKLKMLCCIILLFLLYLSLYTLYNLVGLVKFGSVSFHTKLFIIFILIYEMIRLMSFRSSVYLYQKLLTSKSCHGFHQYSTGVKSKKIFTHPKK